MEASLLATNTSENYNFFCRGGSPGLFILMFSYLLPTIVLFLLAYKKTPIKNQLYSFFLSVLSNTGFCLVILAIYCVSDDDQNNFFVYVFTGSMFMASSVMLLVCFSLFTLGEDNSFPSETRSLMMKKSLSFQEFLQKLNIVRSTQPLIQPRAYKKYVSHCVASEHEIERLKNMNLVKIESGEIEFSTWEDVTRLPSIPSGKSFVALLTKSVQFTESMGEKVSRQCTDLYRRAVSIEPETEIDVINFISNFEENYVIAGDDHSCQAFLSTWYFKVIYFVLYVIGLGNLTESIWLLTTDFIPIEIVKRVSDGEEFANKRDENGENKIGIKLNLNIIGDEEIKKSQKYTEETLKPQILTPYY